MVWIHTALCTSARSDHFPLNWVLYLISVIALYLCLTVAHWTLAMPMHTTKLISKAPHWQHPFRLWSIDAKSVLKNRIKNCLFYTAKTSSGWGEKNSALDQDLLCDTNYNTSCFTAKRFSELLYWHNFYFLELSQRFLNFCLSAFTVRCLSIEWLLLWGFFCQPQKWSKHFTKASHKF